MSRQTPPRRASGERPTQLDPSPEPTAVQPATTTARAESLGLPAVRAWRSRIAGSGEEAPEKPVELVARSLTNSSLPGQIAYDPFSGSGTTIIAAEQPAGPRICWRPGCGQELIGKPKDQKFCTRDCVRGARIFDPRNMCGARTNERFKDGAPCRAGKGEGTRHVGYGTCDLHWGNAPTAETHAADEAAQQALDRLGRPRAVAPQRALLETVWEAAGNVACAREQAGALGADLTMRVSEISQQRSEVSRTNPDGTKVSQGTTVTSAASPETTIRGHVVTIREDVRAIVKLYGEWCDRLNKFAAAAVKAKVAQQEVDGMQRFADGIVRVLEAALAGLPADELERRREIATTEMRAIARTELQLVAANPQVASRN